MNGKRVWMAKHALSTSDLVEVRTHISAPSEPTPLVILYEDAGLLAVHKPAGMISESHTRSVEERIRRQKSCSSLRALHRLDRQTSGVLLFSKTTSHRKAYIELFRARSIQKDYAVLLAGTLPSPRCEVTKRLEGKAAKTQFHLEKAAGGFCRARCRIPTGRTHQIRKHAGEIGCRVLGDTHYQNGPEVSLNEKAVPRHMLHATRTAFQCPFTGAELEIVADPPDDFQQTAASFHLL